MLIYAPPSTKVLQRIGKKINNAKIYINIFGQRGNLRPIWFFTKVYKLTMN